MSKKETPGLRAVKYVPKNCLPDQKDDKGNEIPQLFKGHITLLPPSIEQKFEYLMLTNMSVDADGKATGSTNELLGSTLSLLKKAQEHYVDVSIERVDNGYKYKSYEDLSHDSDCHAMIQEVAGMITNGFSPGKLSSVS